MEHWHEIQREIISTLHLNHKRVRTDAFVVQETIVRTRKQVLS